jgi:hypothetical protein
MVVFIRQIKDYFNTSLTKFCAENINSHQVCLDFYNKKNISAASLKKVFSKQPVDLKKIQGLRK